MPVPTLSFLLGLVVVGYLFTFVIFAILRIVTGVSVQRVGYSGFRRIAFSPRPGLKINIRGIGLSVHRPTFALPTWCSLVVTELAVTVDLRAWDEARRQNGAEKQATKERPRTPADQEDAHAHGHGKLWRQLTEVKEKIKRLHRQIGWLRLLDLIATAVTLNVVGVGSVRMERLTLSVDTRSQTVDRSRLFQHHKHRPETQCPAEWKSLIRSVLFTPEGRESTEVLDYCTLNIHGMLHREREGLRDASIALKLGRVNVPYDDMEHAKRLADLIRGRYAQPQRSGSVSSEQLAAVAGELDDPGSHDESIVRAVSDSREFIASVLRGIQEVQFAVGFVGLSKKLAIKAHGDRNVYFNFAMKELGLDILRLDPKSPAHRMYFSPKDVAHQGLLTGIAIAAGIDDGHEHPERMLYVPMVTATVKTTLPSRTIQASKEDGPADRNTNMLYANFVCTSPSVDLDPKHLPLVREMLKQRSSRRHESQPATAPHHLISQLLPKSHVKFSIQEPVVRISLPPMDTKNAEDGDFDLLISSVSSIAWECESSHATDGRLHYSLNSYYRHSRHKLYYQSSAGDRHDLLHSDFVEVQVDVNAIPDVSVIASGRAQSFTIYLVRPDICEGVRQIVNQFRKNMLANNHLQGKPQASFLRKVPTWLQQFKFEGSEFGLELAGVDEQVSKDTRGFGLQLEAWTTEYKAQRDDDQRTSDPSDRRKSVTRTPTKDKPSKTGDHNFHRKRYLSFADGRRLTFHIQNLEGLIVDSIEESEPESFLSLPRFEVAFSTSTDAHGPIFHINSFAKSIMLQYSLYNHFAVGVAAMVIKKTFLDRQPDEEPRPGLSRAQSAGLSAADPQLAEIAAREITAVDFKSNLVQIKAKMPADPPMMIQIYYLETGRHRWSTPFLRTKLARLYVRAPATKAAWSRVVSIKVLRLDLRDVRRKVGKNTLSEKSIDVASEAIRISIPHSLAVHAIFDNITNVVKTSKQLQHHFKTGTNEYILTKEPEGPKHVPRVTVRSQIFLFDVEDSLFESKLGAIYRAGLLEQKQRIAREEAFELKTKRVSRGAQKGSSRLRAQSAQLGHSSRSRSRNRQQNTTQRSQSTHGERSSPQSSQRHKRGRSIRYDAEGKCGISESAAVSIDKAREKLDLYNAQSWKTRIDRVRTFQSHAIKEIRRLFGVSDDIDDVEQREPILAWSRRPGLMVVALTDLGLTIDKPSFPIEEYPKFLQSVGKGMPRNMEYGLLLPMNLHLTVSEARVQLRDYPLPMLHIPTLANGQSARLPAMSIRTDVVVAEEFRDIESQRSVNVQVVPPEKMKSGNDGFAIDVRRTISAVKTYSDIKMQINTSNPTKISWSTSYQPAIQDTMQVIENFTKPPVDPSDRIGFWDKIRLSFHSRINVAWKGDGDVHFVIKGSRDPYIVTGQGAGLVMVWRDNVNWNIAQHDDPRKFFTVESGEYILAVPDFNNYARHSQDVEHNDDGSSSGSSIAKNNAVFKKVVMKLSGKVMWLAGLMFERDIEDGKRTFDFKPHYDVVLKHPDFAKDSSDGAEYDAYRGFRSHHIHMSIAVSAPHDRDWSVNNLKPSSNYNSVHLTPRFFSHFYSWWSMFSGVMSLPIKQGPLWGITEKKSKKFGRHMATIKYNLLLSPLYISHVYKHKEAEDYAAHSVSATGLKMRLDSFMLDVHQRREHFDLKGKEGARAKTTSGMRINQAQLDFISADLRALSANIEGTSAEDIEKANDETLASLHGQVPLVDMSKFDIPDNDFSWIDMDDFVELDWILPAEADPETRILPLGYAPRFTYFRQTDHNGTIAGDPSRTSPFGDEPTHYCVMSQKNDPRRVQAELIERRLTLIKEKQEQNTRAVGEQELKLVREISHNKDSLQALQAKVNALKNHTEHLEGKHQFLQNILGELLQRLNDEDPSAVPDLETSEKFFEAHENSRSHEPDEHDAAPLADYTSDFNNRFIVHNAQIKWNNSLRNIILRYIHQNGQRRGFVYYMSRRAVKFILDVLEERKKGNEPSTPKRQKSHSTQYSAMSPEADDDETVQDRIDELLRDGRSFVDADEPDNLERWETGGNGGPTDDIAVEFAPLNTYHFRLIAPQVQLQSEKNPKSAVLVTAKGMQLKVVQIMEKDKIDDDVSGLVQRRFNAAADSVQMFVTSTKTFSTEYVHFYSANRYGVKAGTFWPPWVPMEIMFEFQTNPYGFNRVVHRTSASLRYDKYNQLRLKYNDDISGGEPMNAESAEEAESRMDHVWLEFPHFRAICDSAQYFAMYVIAMDLLLYNEPLEKTRSERLEKIMLASDFSDLTGAPEMVGMLQDRIRQLEEIKMHFQVNERFLDRQGWKDRIKLDQDLASCEDELFFMMKAITTSQQHVEERREPDNSGGYMHLHIAAREIAWHLIREKGESLIELQLQDATFDRTDNYDGSNYNSMEITRINGYNLLKDAIYPEIISPFTDEHKGGRKLRNGKMLSVHWLMLEAIAGIPVVDYFEVDLVPLRLQIERDVAKKIFEYIFPGVGGSAFDGGFSPFMVKNMLPTQEEENEDADKQDSQSVLGIEQSEPIELRGDPNGPGSLDARLRPTLTLAKQKKNRPESKGLGISNPSNNHGLHGFAMFQHSDKSSRNVSGTRTPASRQALSQTNLVPARSPSQRSLSTMHSTADSDDRDSKYDKSKRLAVAYRQANDDKKKKDKDKDKERPSDDLTQMMSRASNYMTLAYVKIPSMVLCLSYKGQGKRNIEDVHDLVFKMPTLEYRNKTWSNLDLAMQLKRDVVRALISHAGAIVGNKFSHHKPNKQMTSKLRELANRSTFMSPNSSQLAWVGGQGGNSMPGPADWTTITNNSSETSSFVLESGETSGRPSTAATRPHTSSSAAAASSQLRRSLSYTSSPEDSRSDIGLRFSEDGGPPPSLANGHQQQYHHHNGYNNNNNHSTPSPRQNASGQQRLSPNSNNNGDESRNRAASITRHLTGFSDRLRQRQSQQVTTNGSGAGGGGQSNGADSNEDAEESKRKSKLLLGPQKLLGRLRD
ncbi:Putative FMP27, SW domain, FMP27, GFWDK domain, FMP27, WPPW domain-containing protein [Septoria linicola]|uniref:FMP27, SW domain, FMP27, GFWDK domain, FMP27, WPPW domain-containing protein n=1 Tax=Septoria linicola TaxID=215465 RepID=A0A9Q9EKI5_9PEZI|nr:Putative FMP27, SW domain, FMP27, GFWDK domain, FMP27, WPPW domain-containing protein [Septoria linicola]